MGICKSKPLSSLTPGRADTRPSPAAPPEYAKQAVVHSSDESVVQSPAEGTTAGELQAQLRAVSSDLLYWKGGLKVLRQTRLPKWRGLFKWQIEAKIEALQTEYAKLRTEAANKGG